MRIYKIRNRVIKVGAQFFRFGIIMENGRFWNVELLTTNPENDKAKAMRRAEKDLKNSFKAVRVNSIKAVTI